MTSSSWKLHRVVYKNKKQFASNFTAQVFMQDFKNVGVTEGGGGIGWFAECEGASRPRAREAREEGYGMGRPSRQGPGVYPMENCKFRLGVFEP